ncbi:MAG: hypothetical protein WCK65_16040, partial [Rhodospirillaceae bacterium]
TSDLDPLIATRLGIDTRLVELPAPCPGPFGWEVTTLPLPGWMVPDAPLDATITEVTAADGAVRFHFAGRAFVYDRLGLRREML